MSGKAQPDFKRIAVALQARRRQAATQARLAEVREQEAQAAGLAETLAVAERQGIAVDAPPPGEPGAWITSRDGFTWLCGSTKRRPQLSKAQIAAGLRRRTLAQAAGHDRVTGDYDRLARGGRPAPPSGDAQTDRLSRRLAAADALRRGDTALHAAHPALAAVVERVVGDGVTLSALAGETGKSEPVLLELLRLGLDKLAEVYGYRSKGAA